MIATIARWVLAHKRLVVVFWIVLTVVGGAASGAATNAMKQKFSVPGKEGWLANQEIARLYHGTGGNASPLVPVVTLPAGTSAAQARAQLTGLERPVARALPRGTCAVAPRHRDVDRATLTTPTRRRQP